MRLLRLAILVCYVGYLVDIGLAMLLLPWTPGWGVLLAATPPWAMTVLDLPAVRGLISGFGFLHILLLAAEVAGAPRARRSRG